MVVCSRSSSSFFQEQTHLSGWRFLFVATVPSPHHTSRFCTGLDFPGHDPFNSSTDQGADFTQRSPWGLHEVHGLSHTLHHQKEEQLAKGIAECQAHGHIWWDKEQPCAMQHVLQVQHCDRNLCTPHESWAKRQVATGLTAIPGNLLAEFVFLAQYISKPFSFKKSWFPKSHLTISCPCSLITSDVLLTDKEKQI
jgi:hypothetical protein